MWKIRSLTFLIVIACATIADAAEFEKLTVPDNAALTIDPLDAIGSVLISVVNKSGRSSRVDLHGDSLISVGTHLPSHGATIQLARPGGAAETTELTSEDLPPNQELSVRVLVHNLVEPGDYSLILSNGPVALGQVRVSGFPFRVHPDAPTGNPVSLVMGFGYGGFTLRNDDPFTYRVAWEVTARGRKVTGKTSVGPDRAEQVSFPDCSTPNQSDCHAAEAGLWGAFCLWLRDGSENGQLRISYFSPNNAAQPFAPFAVFPATLSLRAHPPEETTVVGSVVLVLVLALGAFASLFANLWIPHNLKKNALKSRLVIALRRVRELSSSMRSRARVSAEVDCLQVWGRLSDEGCLYSDFEAILLDYETQISALETRVELMIQMDETQRTFEQITTTIVPPSLITGAQEPFDQLSKMFESGEWKDAQLRTAASLVDDLQHRVQNLNAMQSSGQVDADLQKNLLTQLARLRGVYPHPRSGTAARFEQALPGTFHTLDATPADGANLLLRDWAQLDFALWKLSLIERFINAFDGTNSLAWKAHLEQKAGLAEPVPSGSLIYFLELNTWDALNCAQLLCAEVDQGIFPENICKAIADGQVSIGMLQKQITSERRVDLEVGFSNYAYNHAAARSEITPIWTFTPTVPRRSHFGLKGFFRKRKKTADPRTEKGWGVSCLARPYRFVDVKVCFEDWYGEVKVGGDGGGLSASYPIESNRTGLVWPRFMMEMSKLLLGLSVPILGLLGGAREKLLTMDVSAALATVFVLGFGADSIKNALTRGTVSAPGPTPPPRGPVASATPVATPKSATATSS
jgi:hypothetical protein